MKKTASFIIFTLIAVMLCTVGASADCGPKPSVTVTFPEVKAEFYVTLLSEKESCGPYSGASRDLQLDLDGEPDASTAAYLKFCAYEDADGFYFLGMVGECNGETDSFDWCWGYYPPDVFKVLVYYPATDSFAVSGILKSYAFSSYFTVRDNGDGTLWVKQSYNYLREAVGFGIRVCLTLAVELAMAWMFGYFTPDKYRVIITVNIITQVLLNLGLNAVNFKRGFIMMAVTYVLLEILVFAIEGVVYTVKFTTFDENGKRCGTAKVWVFSLAANVLSFAAGLFIIQGEMLVNILIG